MDTVAGMRLSIVWPCSSASCSQAIPVFIYKIGPSPKEAIVCTYFMVVYRISGWLPHSLMALKEVTSEGNLG